MAGVNKVILVGNLGSDPETRTIESGAKVANFSIATTERFKDKNGNAVDRTEWHNIVMWRGLAEIAEKYLKKGSQVFIEGKLRTRSWDDQNGNKRYTTEVLADNMTMLGGPAGSSSGSAQSSSPSQPQQNQVNEPHASSLDDIDDDLPF
ncbi:MAG: single-stranded DNA-binding protein [Flavobacteriales bacterium]|nr:single-stranded DNA-binding protein [Flavobacteriales bacterium]